MPDQLVGEWLGLRDTIAFDSMGKELYLYAQYPMLLCRLNLSKLSDTDLEVIHDFGNDRYPEGMGMMIVDSKPYLFGGEKVSPVPVGADEYEYQSTEEIFCFDAYLLDPTSREDPLVSDGSIPKLGGPKIRPIVVTIERKTYVLTRPPLLSSFYELKGPHFEVFDHGNRTWERVNDPPVFDRERGKTIVTYFAWGHRLLLRTLGGLSIFDTRKLIWEDGRSFLDQLRRWPSAAPFPTGTAAEIEGGFYIALSIDKNELVAYEFDPDGVLKSYRVLDEISDVFSSEPQLALEYCTGFVTRIGGDGRMCFVFGGPTFGEWSGVRVAVFRVSAVTGGLSVDVECLKFFDLQDFDPIHYTIDSIMVISTDTECLCGQSISEPSRTAFLDLDCVRKVRSMGEANWKQFASDEVTEMKGHLMKYPVEVDRKGKVRPLPGCESFPDVGGQIVGSFLAIQENLTI